MRVNNRAPNQIDPVCQIKVLPSSEIKPVVWGSRAYYFCTDACRKAFMVDPEKYLPAKRVKRKGWWGRYLERLNKATGGKPPCCH